jgi:glycosyltransferase involved in cell wall biosynthesis
VRPPRIIAFAYACEPGEGSEAGAGWIHARMLAGLGETWVLTRGVPPDTGSAWPHGLAVGDGYDTWLRGLPEQGRLRFVHVQIPWWDEFWWNRPNRPAFTRLQRVEYFVWLWLALRTARRLMRAQPFDAGWHLTWANAWLGSTLPLTGLPYVYGPVGGGVAPPWRLAASLGARAFAAEIFRQVIRSTFRYLNPLGRLATRRAALILVQNKETRDWLPGSSRARTVVLPNAVVTGIKRRPPYAPTVPYTALFAGRLDGFKGASFAIRTMALLPDWRLVIAGDGPAADRLRRLVHELGLADRVEFLGQVPRDDLLELMQGRADLLLFPSLHEEAGFAVAEAVATGIPVVCLDWGGPPILGGIGVRPGSLRRTIRDLAEAVRAAPIGLPSPPAPTMESRKAELVELVRRFGVFEPDPLDDDVSAERGDPQDS